MSVRRQKPKLWLEKSSSDDRDSKIIRQRMGMTVADFLAALGGGTSHGSADLRCRVWPKHSSNEIRDPIFTMCTKDPSELEWSVRYKALGCYDRDNSAPLSSVESHVPNDLSNDMRLREDRLTPAQQKELIETLQLSDSDEENSVEEKPPSPQEKSLSIMPKQKIAAQVSSGRIDEKSNLPQPIPIASEVGPLQAAMSSSSIKQVRTHCAENVDKSKPRRRIHESLVRLEGPQKPSVYSPLAVRVTEINAGSSHNQHSTDANALSSLPVQCLSNQENLPSADKQADSSEQFVRRVLADAEAFCKPLQRLPNNFHDTCQGFSKDSDGHDISLHNVENNGTLILPKFSLKRVSPLSGNSIGLERPAEDSLVSPKKRLVSKDVKNPLPVVTSDKEQRLVLRKVITHEYSKPGLDSAWILSSVGINELRSHLPSVPVSDRRSSCLDKLASLRFFLRSLRVPSATLRSTVARKLTGVLLAPEIPKPVPKFAEIGTTMTPKRTVVSETQYDSKNLVTSVAQTSQMQTSVSTNTSPFHKTLKMTSVSVNTDPLRLGVIENGFAADSVDYYLQKLLGHNNSAIERTIRSFEDSTEEEQLTRASNLDTEASNCWTKLVKFVAATSSSSSAPANSLRPFICSCTPDTQRLIHSLFNQTDFTSYPEKILSSTRHLLVAALMSTSILDAKRRYEQALESLAKTASRMRRAESKLLRRAWVAMQRSGGVDSPITGVAELGGDAKRWSDLWYSALARVRAVVSDKFHQLITDKEQELRKEINQDAFLKHLKLLNTEEDLLTVCSSPSPAPSRNGSADSRLYPQSKPDKPDESKSDMCTVPRSTLERLVKVFQITSLADESVRSRQESELILPTDKFAIFGCEVTGTQQHEQSKQQLPVFVASAPSTNMTPLIVYIDSVLQVHKQILSCLAVCPEMQQYQSSVISTPQSKKPHSPFAPPPALQPIPKPSAKRKRKHSKSPVPPPPPAFEDLPIRPHDPVVSKQSKHRRHRQSSQSDETIISELGEASKKRKKHRDSSSLSGQTAQSSDMRKRNQQEDGRPRKHIIRSSSVAPSSRDFDRNDGDETDDSTHGKKPRERHRSRGRSVISPIRERSDTHLNGSSGLETYSPRKNSSINAPSYSPSRPAFSNERQSSSGAGKNTCELTYIPSVPVTPASRRTIPRELPSKPPVDPDFYAKWMGRSSSTRR